MTMKLTMKALYLAAGVSVAVSPLVASFAAAKPLGQAYPSGNNRAPQDYDDRGQGYDEQDDQQAYDDRGPPPQGYDDRDQQYATDDGYDRAPPAGYDGTRPPPPPAGYSAAQDDPRQREMDDQYALTAERWSQDNCVKSRDNTGVGAVVGGVIGALVGNGLSNRRDRTGGTIAGAAIGAVGGAAVGSASSNQTSPGCPPGFVVRQGAPGFAYGADYAYAAPGWYRPWVFTGGAWLYRPYPYRAFYARHYRPFRGGYRPYRAYRGRVVRPRNRR